MIAIQNESDLRNWFKKNYRKLGFSKIISSSTKDFPDFIMLENGKKVGVELETKSSNFNMHKHSNVDKVICIIKDAKLSVPTIKIDGLELSKEKESFYSIRRQVYNLFKKTKVLTTSEAASLADIHWNSAEKALLELVLENKVTRLKKAGVNLWVLK